MEDAEGQEGEVMFITLTEYSSDKSVYIRAESILYVGKGGNGTRIEYGAFSTEVIESPEKVLEIIQKAEG